MPVDPSSRPSPSADAPSPEAPSRPVPASSPTAQHAARERLAQVAELYWVRGMKVEAVGKSLGISRSTVSRLLAQAREQGVIEFVVHREPDQPGALRRRLHERFGVAAFVAPVGMDETAALRRLAVGQVAAAWLGALVHDESVVGVSWGNTVEAVSAQLSAQRTAAARIVQMHGSGNVSSLGAGYASRTLERFGAAFHAPVQLFPVPAVFDAATTRDAMWQESSIRQVLEARRATDLLVTSVGTAGGDRPGRLYESGYLSGADLEELRAQKVVGNLASVFFRADGSTAGIRLNDRSSGMPLDEVRAISTRLFVVADAAKAAALRAMIGIGLVSHLVVDPGTARALVEME